MEDDLGGNAYELEGDAGCDGARDGGCWRMRRKPDIPSPCSCSGSIGVLVAGSKTVDEFVSKETLSFRSSTGFLVFARRSPVLRFFGSLRTLGSDSNLSSCETLCLRLVSVEERPYQSIYCHIHSMQEPRIEHDHSPPSRNAVLSYLHRATPAQSCLENFPRGPLQFGPLRVRRLGTALTAAARDF